MNPPGSASRIRRRSLWRIYRRVIANSTGVMLAYRANLLYFFLFESFFLVSSFLGAGLGVSLAGGDINGWGRDQMFALTAINGLSHQFFICFLIAPLFNMPEFIWNGRMDHILQKPVHPLIGLMASSEVMVSNIPNLLINLGLAIYFVSGVAANSQIVTGTWLMFFFLVVLGIAVRFALALFCMAPAFFAERLIEGEDGFWNIAGMGRFPTSVFPKVVERILLYVIPLSMMAAVPAGFLFGRLGSVEALGASLGTILFVGIAFFFFNVALRSYKSVNSGM